MELIKRGRKQEDTEAVWTCISCGSVYKAKKSEGRYVSDQRDGDAIVFKCPNCGRENWVSLRVFV